MRDVKYSNHTMLTSSPDTIESGSSTYDQLLGAISTLTPARFVGVSAGITAAERDCDISPEQAKTLRCLMAVHDQTDEGKVLLEKAPNILPKDRRAQLMLEHRFRVDNGCDEVCPHMQRDVHDGCVKCLIGIPEDCTRICPARNNTEAHREMAELVA